MFVTEYTLVSVVEDLENICKTGKLLFFNPSLLLSKAKGTLIYIMLFPD